MAGKVIKKLKLVASSSSEQENNASVNKR